MKKAYEKPILYAESFELMEHVAGDCAVNDGFAGAHWRDPGSCRYDLIAEGGAATGQALFYSSGNGCDMDLFTGFDVPATPEGLAMLGLDCYNSFLITSALFAS